MVAGVVIFLSLDVSYRNLKPEDKTDPDEKTSRNETRLVWQNKLSLKLWQPPKKGKNRVALKRA